VPLFGAYMKRCFPDLISIVGVTGF
jgi:hypothetical protein